MGGLLLATALALTTYSLTRSYLLDQRERAAVRVALLNAEAVNTRLRLGETDLPGLLDTLSRGSGSETLVLLDDQVFGSSVTDTPARLPRAFLAALRAERGVMQRFHEPDAPHLAIGVPLPTEGAGYVEVVSLAELERTLGTLASTLLAAAAVTCVSFAGLGFVASRRALRPVADVSAAASAIASGQLDTRLDAVADPDLRALADSFNGMADSLQRRIDRDARFTADVSHELRSPLTTLATSFSVLEGHQQELTERPRHAVRLLSHEIERFTRLVEDLLEISRADAGLALELDEVRVDDLLRETVARSAYNDVAVEVESGVEMRVAGDKRRLDRVLMNLLDNASQHAGGAVRVAARRVAATVEIEVDDAGPGVLPEERERIFERFARGAAAGSRRRGHGTGLGLALVLEHVHAHGGTVRVVDRPGGGARFVVALPAAP